MGGRVTLSEQAEADLEASVRFLAQFSSAAAERIGLELVDAIFSLTELPRRGAPVKTRPGLRRLLHRTFFIYYRLDEGSLGVEVIRIWDARRNPLQLRLP